MSATNNKAEEILNKSQSNKSPKHWTHSNVNNDEMLGAHWNSNPKRSKHATRKLVFFPDTLTSF